MEAWRRQAAGDALEGLSVGDAFGERFFVSDAALAVEQRRVPPAPWGWTDDTSMAASVFAVLVERGSVDQDALAGSFARRFDPARNYGPAMERILPEIGAGEPWEVVAGSLFDGQGSWGNGAAMRVAPVGAWFSEDLDRVGEQARRSAVVTHAHPEAVAGAVAVAVGAALAHRGRGEPPPRWDAFLGGVEERTPPGLVAEGLYAASRLSGGIAVEEAVASLGNGSRISAQDTVPFALWCAAHELGSFEEAMWRTVTGLGDADTNCAIVGGVVASYLGAGAIPAEWRRAREALPAWVGWP